MVNLVAILKRWSNLVPMGETRLYGPDALRGIAAIMVLLYHMQEVIAPGTHLYNGMLPVDLFFMLSGFVLARTYEDRMRSGLGAISFIGIRYRRLFFPVFIGISIGFAVQILRHSDPLELAMAAGLNMLLLPAFWLPNCFILNLPLWSLFVEIALNWMHAVLLVRLSKQALGVLTLAASAVFVGGRLTGHFGWDFDALSMLGLLPEGLACYGLGIWLFRAFGDRPMGRWPWAPVAALPISLIVLGGLPMHWQQVLFIFVACPLFLRASLNMRENATAHLLGAISFPLYAVHMPILWMAEDLGRQWLPVATVVSFALAALLAWQFNLSSKRKVEVALKKSPPSAATI